MKKYANLKRTERVFKDGDWVYLAIPTTFCCLEAKYEALSSVLWTLSDTTKGGNSGLSFGSTSLVFHSPCFSCFSAETEIGEIHCTNNAFASCEWSGRHPTWAWRDLGPPFMEGPQSCGGGAIGSLAGIDSWRSFMGSFSQFEIFLLTPCGPGVLNRGGICYRAKKEVEGIRKKACFEKHSWKKEKISLLFQSAMQRSWQLGNMDENA